MVTLILVIVWEFIFLLCYNFVLEVFYVRSLAANANRVWVLCSAAIIINTAVIAVIVRIT